MSAFRSPALALHQLETREVPAIGLVGSQLLIHGGDHRDVVTITSQFGPGDPVPQLVARRVETRTVQGVTITTADETRRYNLSAVQSITVLLFEGANSYTSTLGTPATVYGGGEADTITGGSGGDQLYGSGGNDTVDGGGGNDTLDGGNGNDRLYGNAGNDVLRGGSGVDRLFGGAGADQLTGGGESDRFLQVGVGHDVVTDKSVADVTTVFVHSPSGYTTSHGNEYGGALWTDDRVLVADRALGVLHETTGDATFLRRDGDDIRIRIVGSYVPGTGDGEGAKGWNDGSDTINIVSSNFSSPVRGEQVVLHEIGHYWDQPDENTSADQFRALSGWSKDLSLADDPAYTLSGDGGWVHHSSAEFTRGYGKTNPREDFAECFALYWLHQMGEDSVTAVNQFEDLPEKMNYMAGFVAGLS